MLAGRSVPLLVGNGDWLLPPNDLELTDGRVEFLRENQGVWSLFVREMDLSTDDPPVYIEDGNRIEALGATVSTFALQWALYSATFAAYSTACQCVAGLDTRELKARAPALPWRPWTLFGPHLQIRLHAADDAVVQLHVTDIDEWVWVGARTVESLERVMGCVDGEWQVSVGDGPFSVWRATTRPMNG